MSPDLDLSKIFQGRKIYEYYTDAAASILCLLIIHKKVTAPSPSPSTPCQFLPKWTFVMIVTKCHVYMCDLMCQKWPGDKDWVLPKNRGNKSNNPWTLSKSADWVGERGGRRRVTRKLKYKVTLEAVSVCHKGRAFLSTRRSILGSDFSAN